MKIRKTLMAVMLLALTATTASAQAPEYRFKQHTYLDLQAGAQYTVGEASFKNLISPNVQVGLGYQLTPIFGVRLAANAWQSKGGVVGLETHTYKFRYIAAGLDLMFNMTNLIAGWDPHRLLDIDLFVGGGANMGFHNNEANDLANRGYTFRYLWSGKKVRPYGRGGVRIGFRLSECVQLQLEGNLNLISDKYNSKYGDNKDKYYNLLAGVRINLSKPCRVIEHNEEIVEPTFEEPAPVTQTVVEQPKPQPKPEPKPVVKPVEPIQREVFFLINKANIQPGEATKIKDVADYMKEHSNAKVSIIGYADAKTGNDKINDRLSKKRAEAVRKVLTDQYGIAADRITTDAKGAHIQPFSQNDKNRVTILLAK